MKPFKVREFIYEENSQTLIDLSRGKLGDKASIKYDLAITHATDYWWLLREVAVKTGATFRITGWDISRGVIEVENAIAYETPNAEQRLNKFQRVIDTCVTLKIIFYLAVALLLTAILVTGVFALFNVSLINMLVIFGLLLVACFGGMTLTNILYKLCERHYFKDFIVSAPFKPSNSLKPIFKI